MILARENRESAYQVSHIHEIDRSIYHKINRIWWFQELWEDAFHRLWIYMRWEMIVGNFHVWNKWMKIHINGISGISLDN